MVIRPYHAWLFLAAVPVISVERALEWAGRDGVRVVKTSERWPLLARMTTEELDHGLAHRYRDLARDLGGERDVGYFEEKHHATLWGDSSPEGQKRIERYYMAQSILAPSILRKDERWPRIVVDCQTPAEASAVVDRMALTVVHDFGAGLLLARPTE
jgi:hypothetical protein